MSILLFPSLAQAADTPLQLAVTINGTNTGLVAAMVERDGRLFAKPSELEQIGLGVPPGVAQKDGLVPLATLPGVSFKLDERNQSLAITASISALRPNQLGPGVRGVNVPLTAAAPGLLLDYDLQGTRVSNQATGAGLFDTRMFGLLGVFDSSAVAYTLPAPGQTSFVRLDSSWTWADPDSLHRITVGDTVNGGLSWTRPLRMGGIQVNTDFGLQPGIVTFPLPTITGQAALPSTADILVNGVRQFSQQVTPGPFQVQQPPVLSGAGTIELAVQDPLGHQTVTTIPFYISPTMLRPGLAAFSVEAGAARRDYGFQSDDYTPVLGSGTLRYGVNHWLTVEGHAEGTGGLEMAGLGGLIAVGNLGVVAASAAASRGLSSGTQFTLGFQRQSTLLSFGASVTRATSGFRDLASVTGAPIVRSVSQANVGLSLGRFGSFAAAYVQQKGTATAASVAAQQTVATPLLPIAPSFRVITASYTNQLTERLSLLATAFESVSGTRDFGFEIGLSFSFGNRGNLFAGASHDSTTGTSSIAQLQQSAYLPGEFGYSLLDQEGGNPRRLGQGQYIGDLGEAIIGVDQAPGYTAGRAELRGATGWLAGAPFVTRWIDDSFAVVQSGDTPGIGVLSENRLVGRTDSSGRLLVPDLRGWDTNAIALQPTDLPPDVTAGSIRELVRPPEKSGVAVKFQVQRARSAIVVLVDTGGKPLPVGTQLQRADGSAAIVGYDGETYLEDLAPDDTITAEPHGSRCHAKFHYKPVPGSIPRIGPVVCQ